MLKPSTRTILFGVLIGFTLLYLNLNEITDVTPLARLTNLEKLGISGNPIADVTPLAGLTNLTELYLSNNKITDVSSAARI